MAKKDPFEKFRQATLGGQTESPLKAALAQEPKASEPVDTRVPVRPATAPVAAEPVQVPAADTDIRIRVGKGYCFSIQSHLLCRPPGCFLLYLHQSDGTSG